MTTTPQIDAFERIGWFGEPDKVGLVPIGVGEVETNATRYEFDNPTGEVGHVSWLPLDVVCPLCGYWNWEHDKGQARGCQI